ncbi:MAG: DUF4824 family protein [Gammaproteobacteria bacterium]|nr:DUF4824 family protein [Gammaproteobacteria bacterium]MBU1646523.1 DUF4824 family protein [Gammaproteobacteria bacterium]MBU1973710.1 DUF4824 family protein [Gammaproteobacteria bacterium]
MTAWSRARTLAAGAALILLTNAVALGGVWWNRTGEPESLLVLTERELPLPYRGYRSSENSGLEFRLGWRVGERDGNVFYGYAGSGGMPEWLDGKRMEALGFATYDVDGGEEARRRYSRQQPREVLVVLELAGPAWQQALERARENAARHAAAAAVNVDSKEFANRAKVAQDALQREERANSRLFAIDVGRDLAKLRTTYPDRGRYMIVKGTVRPRVANRDKKYQPAGYIGDIGAGRINIPFALRPVLERLPPGQRAKAAEGDPRYEARLAIGQRLEPWIAALRATPAAP